MMYLLLLFIYFLSILSITSSREKKEDSIIYKEGQSNILALSGGGSFGMVDVGILSGMYETGEIPEHFDLLSGISAGGLNVGFLSYYNNTLYGLNDLYKLYAGLNNSDVYKLELLKILHLWKFKTPT